MFAIIFVFIFGLMIGSFINALVYRIQNNLSLNGRSFCPKCKKQITWYDNIPIVSWVLLRGKCRSCGKSISVQYPFVELLTGLAFLITFQGLNLINTINNYFTHYQALGFQFFSLILITGFVIFIFVLNALYDFKFGYLLSEYIYAGIIVVIMLLFVTHGFDLTKLLPYFLSGAIPALIFFALTFFSKGQWMGEGDWELVLLIGLFLGYPKVIIALYFAFIVGAIFGLLGVYLKKYKLKTALPFGPFLIAGTFFSLLFGEQLFSIYAKIFLGG